MADNKPTRVSDKALAKMRQDAEWMLAMRSPAVDEDWWRCMLAIVIEAQERRIEGGVQ